MRGAVVSMSEALPPRPPAATFVGAIALPTPRWSPEIYVARRAKAFWEKVDKDGPIHPYDAALGHCWIWTGTRTEFGHGQFRFNGKIRAASVVAMFLATGTWPPVDRPQVLHSCDNAPCVNDAHLRFGTQLDNVRDSMERGRLNTEAGLRRIAVYHQSRRLSAVSSQPGTSASL